MAPVGCAVAPPISGLLHIEGIPVEGLVDTGASVTCLGFALGGVTAPNGGLWSLLLTRAGCTWQTAPDSREDAASGHPVG